MPRDERRLVPRDQRRLVFFGASALEQDTRTALAAGLDDAALSSLRFLAAGASGSPYFICEVKARRSA